MRSLKKCSHTLRLLNMLERKTTASVLLAFKTRANTCVRRRNVLRNLCRAHAERSREMYIRFLTMVLNPRNGSRPTLILCLRSATSMDGWDYTVPRHVLNRQLLRILFRQRYLVRMLLGFRLGLGLWVRVSVGYLPRTKQLLLEHLVVQLTASICIVYITYDLIIFLSPFGLCVP